MEKIDSRLEKEKKERKILLCKVKKVVPSYTLSQVVSKYVCSIREYFSSRSQLRYGSIMDFTRQNGFTHERNQASKASLLRLYYTYIRVRSCLRPSIIFLPAASFQKGSCYFLPSFISAWKNDAPRRQSLVRYSIFCCREENENARLLNTKVVEIPK